MNRTDWDVSHSPTVHWDGMDVRIHTHTCGIGDGLGCVPLSHMVRWYGMDIRIHTHTCGIWDGLGCVPLSHGTLGRDGRKDTHAYMWYMGRTGMCPILPWYAGTGWT